MSIPRAFQGVPATVGEHIRKKRLNDGLTQKQVGELIGVNACTILNWEKSKTKPTPRDWPSIAAFVGYEIFPDAQTIAEKLRVERLRRGWSRKVAAKELGLDESTLRDWEAGKVVLFMKHRVLVANYLNLPFEVIDVAMREAWNTSHTCK